MLVQHVFNTFRMLLVLIQYVLLVVLLAVLQISEL